MTNQLDDLQRLKGHIQNLIAMRKRQQRLSEKSFLDMTPRQAQKVSADQAWLGMDIDKAEREAHAAAVDLGIADARGEGSYAAVDYRPSGFHHYRHTPSRPRCMEE